MPKKTIVLDESIEAEPEEELEEDLFDEVWPDEVVRADTIAEIRAEFMERDPNNASRMRAYLEELE